MITGPHAEIGTSAKQQAMVKRETVHSVRTRSELVTMFCGMTSILEDVGNGTQCAVNQRPPAPNAVPTTTEGMSPVLQPGTPVVIAVMGGMTEGADPDR